MKGLSSEQCYETVHCLYVSADILTAREDSYDTNHSQSRVGGRI